MVIDQFVAEEFTVYQGDCCEVTKGLPDSSVDFCIHSPPFSNLFIYSDSEADLGNSGSNDEFIEHYKYLIEQLYRVTVPGRLCCVHCKDLPKYANRDDTAGLIDFPGMIIRAFEERQWSYHSRVTIWKCPVVERERTNNNGLLHKTVLRDRSQVRQGMADYLLLFRKPPVGTLMSDKPIVNLDSEGTPRGFEHYLGTLDPRLTDDHPSPYARMRSRGSNDNTNSINIWRRYAEPVWWDIDQMDVLNYKAGRSDRDERHICPLQIDLIERAIDIWSMPGEIIFSPFAGVGSEGVGAIRRGRKFVGVELKPEYYRVAITECETAVKRRKGTGQRELFSSEVGRSPDAEMAGLETDIE